MAESDHIPMGLRERNKERRRTTILNCAYELFAERGYAATTIADIAAAADIAPRTVSLYFPTKQDIVLESVESMFRPINEAILNLHPGESALDSILGSLGASLKNRNFGDAEILMTSRLKADPEIHGIITTCVENLYSDTARAIASEFGSESIDQRMRVGFAALRGVVEYAMFATSPEEIDEILALGGDFVRAGLRQLAGPEGAPAN